MAQLTLSLVYLYMRLFEAWGSMYEFLRKSFGQEIDSDLIIIRILKVL